jgi:hypothetical protein
MNDSIEFRKNPHTSVVNSLINKSLNKGNLRNDILKNQDSIQNMQIDNGSCITTTNIDRTKVVIGGKVS